MYYIQSKAIKEHWQKVGYKPSFEEKVSLAVHNFGLPVWDRIEALRTISHEENIKDKEVEFYTITADKYLKKFESNEEDEPHVYFVESECKDKYKNVLFEAYRQHFSTIEEVKEFIERHGKKFYEFYFDVEKIYIKKPIRSIRVQYRYQGGKYDITDLSLQQAEDPNNNICYYDYYFFFDLDIPYNNLPFKKGDIIINYANYNTYVLSEINYEEELIRGFYFDEEGKLQETDDLWPFYLDYLTYEEEQEEESKESYQKLKFIQSCIKNEISANEVIAKIKEEN